MSATLEWISSPLSVRLTKSDGTTLVLNRNNVIQFHEDNDPNKPKDGKITRFMTMNYEPATVTGIEIRYRNADGSLPPDINNTGLGPMDLGYNMGIGDATIEPSDSIEKIPVGSGGSRYNKRNRRNRAKRTRRNRRKSSRRNKSKA